MLGSGRKRKKKYKTVFRLLFFYILFSFSFTFGSQRFQGPLSPISLRALDKTVVNEPKVKENKIKKEGLAMDGELIVWRVLERPSFCLFPMLEGRTLTRDSNSEFTSRVSKVPTFPSLGF